MEAGSESPSDWIMHEEDVIMRSWPNKVYHLTEHL